MRLLVPIQENLCTKWQHSVDNKIMIQTHTNTHTYILCIYIYNRYDVILSDLMEVGRSRKQTSGCT